MTIKTNNHWREFKTRYDVPLNILKSQFDWTDDDMFDGFFEYRGIWYHISQFMRWTCPQEDSELESWHGFYSDSFFSGVLIFLSEDGERYKVATYYG